MTVEFVETRDDYQMIKVAGEITAANSADFSSELKRCREEYADGGLILDLSELRYISSAGLRVLLTLSQKEGSKVKLIHASEVMREILDETGFSGLFDVE